MCQCPRKEQDHLTAIIIDVVPHAQQFATLVRARPAAGDALRPHRSLSAIARHITGTRWNGWTFFGLKGRAGA